MTRMTPSQQQWSKAQAILTYRQPLPWQRGVPPQIPWIRGHPWVLGDSPSSRPPRHGAQCVLRLVCEEHWTSGLAVGCGSQVLPGFLNYSAIFGRRIPGEPWVSPSVCIYTHTFLYNVYTYIKCLKQILGLPVWIFHTFDSCRVWTLCFNIT